MNIFTHIKTKKRLATNYKVMFSFFNQNKNFVCNHAGVRLRNKNITVDSEVLIFRNPFDKFASFYADKIRNGRYKSLDPKFVSKLAEFFGIDMMNAPLEEVREKVTIDALAFFLPEIVLSEPHIFPQRYCMNWVRPKRVIRMESDLHILSGMFDDTDFSEKKNVTGQKDKIGEDAKNVIKKVYFMDFDFMYPEFL